MKAGLEVVVTDGIARYTNSIGLVVVGKTVVAADVVVAGARVEMVVVVADGRVEVVLVLVLVLGLVLVLVLVLALVLGDEVVVEVDVGPAGGTTPLISI